MAENDAKTSEDAEMSDCDGQKVVTMMDVLQEQQDFEEDANAVLGASDDKNCTYPKGYVKRQAVYACLTCCPDASKDPDKRAGVCLACSLTCHENHELAELYTKRNFRCDCGNPKFSQPCQFTPNKSDLNYDNKYNQNFSGVYCTCRRPYPDPEATDEEEMIQCIICEDWLHTNHLEATVPNNDLYAEMICKDCMEDTDFLHDYSDLVVNVVDKEIIVTDPDLDVATILKNKAKKEAEKQASLTNGASETPVDKEAADNAPDSITDAENKETPSTEAEAKPEDNGDASETSKEETNKSDQDSEEKKDAETPAESEADANDKVANNSENDKENSEKTSPESTEICSTENKESDKPENSNEMESASESKEQAKSDEATESPDKPQEETESPAKAKRKLSTEESEDISTKKAKLDTKPCIRPRGVKRVYKGATFWPSNLRQKLCTCNECVAMYKDLGVLYLTDMDDTVTAYEALGKINNEGEFSSQYEKGLQALSSLDRVQQINALTEYNKMRDKLLDFLKSFKERKEIVKEEDIKAFFAGMKPKREPDGVYFCR